MKSELSKLVELQKTDTRIRQLKQNIETAEERRATLEQEFDQHASSIREIQNTKTEAQEKKKELETKIADAKIQLERANRNLTTATDTKQYEAAMREADVLNKQVSTHETGILEQLETIDETDKVLDERSEEIKNLESDWKKTQSDFDKQLKSDQKELEKLKTERETVFKEVSPKLANAYNRLITRSRDGVAVAEVIDGSCSACFMKLRKQMVIQLKTTDNIYTCESCTKILYVDNSKEQSEATAS
ncbi:MAG: C4-type zinc ribbon domain-containing protein [Acidobacteriota bacterium]|nr:C4-type zinc ribbon domain-containing protein [Acidobacteriota bacterium]